MARILIVDNDQDTCTFIEGLLAGSGREIVSASDPDEAMARIRREPFDVLISDINLDARQTGLDVLKAFKAEHPSGQAVLISGFGTLETAIEAMRARPGRPDGGRAAGSGCSRRTFRPDRP